MKVYQISATIIIEDKEDESRIKDICNENIQTAVLEDFYISNCIVDFELKETINYPDTPGSENDPDGRCYDNWINKSQEVIDKILSESKNENV